MDNPADGSSGLPTCNDNTCNDVLKRLNSVETTLDRILVKEEVIEKTANTIKWSTLLVYALPLLGIVYTAGVMTMTLNSHSSRIDRVETSMNKVEVDVAHIRATIDKKLP